MRPCGKQLKLISYLKFSYDNKIFTEDKNRLQFIRDKVLNSAVCTNSIIICQYVMSTLIEKGEYDDNLERNTPNKREKYYSYLRHTIAINDVSQWTSLKTRKNDLKQLNNWWMN